MAASVTDYETLAQTQEPLLEQEGDEKRTPSGHKGRLAAGLFDSTPPSSNEVHNTMGKATAFANEEVDRVGIDYFKDKPSDELHLNADQSY